MLKTAVCHRTGFGFDSHAFGTDGTLALGGVHFDGVPALHGHSDGDAVIHAVIDALLGAASLGDIGDAFPDTATDTKGISSVIFLEKTVERLDQAGFSVAHLDIVVLANRPKLSTRKAEIRDVLANELKVGVDQVSVKAKTQEGMNLFGAEGGIAVWAVATLAAKE
jgi:2-C-methyl-D-erythritol 2,4-cyclodiphosphate synthase